MNIVKVGLDIPVDKTFDYFAVATPQDIGRRVTVPFGNRKIVGIILGLAENSTLSEGKLKPVVAIHRDFPALDEHLQNVFEFCSHYYHHPIGEIALNALPPGLKTPKATISNKTQKQTIEITPLGKSYDVSTLPKNSAKRRLLETLRDKIRLSREEIKKLSVTAVKLLPALAADRLIIIETSSCFIPSAEILADDSKKLNPAQVLVMEQILQSWQKFNVFLLHGVTGSGKTEIYLNLIAKALQANQQILVLVPEINLTPQLENIFRKRFPSVPQICLHSYLAKGERTSSYLAAQSGNARIVLSTRLGVFTPLPDLGLIIVDEEHDNSFKQQDGLRYSARDIAIYRAKQLNIPIVLGSATPSLESFYNAQTQRFQLLTLSERAVPKATLPDIELIATTKNEPALSETVIEAIRQRINRGEQSLVFINRRGYAPVLLCNQCHWISTCTRCSTRLTLHLKKRVLSCHHCGFDTAIPQHCPSCGNQDMRAIGQGTQRIESLLAEALPGARILRVDRDTISSKKQLTHFVEQVKNQQVDILVGTQMLAKGHDFPHLTLVAVLNADASLYSSDFRAEENLFSQLMQVSGRAGRATLPGKVLVQTSFPDHPLFTALKRHDYVQFAEYQLQVRKQNNFPPYSYLALLRAESEDDDLVKEFTLQAKLFAKPISEGLHIFDAVAAPIFRLANRFRYQLLVQSNSRALLQRFLNEWRSKLEDLANRKIRWVIDVDPIDF